MKGFILSKFLDFTEETQGLEILDKMIIKCNLKSKGVYSAYNYYDFDELKSLIKFLSKEKQKSVESILEDFGIFLFPHLASNHSYLMSNYSNPLDLISGVESHIHSEIKKLYKDADLPTFFVSKKTTNSLILIYRSKKNLSHLAMGLIKGVINHFKAKGIISIDTNYKKNNDVKFLIKIY